METALSRIARNTLSYLPVIGLVPTPASLRDNGISLMVRTKNEQWSELSIRSVKDFADEIVVVDSSTDETPNVIQKVVSQEGLNLKLIKYQDKTNSVLSNGDAYTEVSNIALQNTSFRWVFKWDGDLVAKTSGKYAIAKLRERILRLDERKYYMIFLTYANLDGDLFHTADKKISVSNEAHLFTSSPMLIFKNTGLFETLKLPLYYKPIFINEIYIFHLRTVKSAEQLLYREFWCHWRELSDYARFPTLQDYIRFRIQNNWNVSDSKEAARINLMKLCQRLVPFNKETYGDYPELLREHMENPKYKLIYRNGKIVGRNDVGFF